MDQNALKMLAAKAALHYIEDGITLGVGSGSTVNCFIEALGAAKMQFADIVTASDESTRRLEALGYRVSDLNSVGRIDVYVDGCDEINPHKAMIKGGGAALTREKIVAACWRNSSASSMKASRCRCWGASRCRWKSSRWRAASSRASW